MEGWSDCQAVRNETDILVCSSSYLIFWIWHMPVHLLCFWKLFNNVPSICMYIVFVQALVALCLYDNFICILFYRRMGKLCETGSPVSEQ